MVLKLVSPAVLVRGATYLHHVAIVSFSRTSSRLENQAPPVVVSLGACNMGVCVSPLLLGPIEDIYIYISYVVVGVFQMSD